MSKPIGKIRTFSVFLVLSFGHESIAQNGTLRFENIGVSQGFVSTWVTTIKQDSKGYIWIGTADGLKKYDGYTFTTYKFDPLDSNSLPQNYVYTIWEDKEGFVWTSTFEGLCKFDRSTDKFTRYKPDPSSKFSDPNILTINEDSTGVMWVGSASGQLARFNRQTGKFYDENFDLGFRNETGGPSVHDAIFSMYKDREGMLWVGNTKGLHKLNIQPRKGQVSSVTIEHYYPESGNPRSLNGGIVTDIFEDHEGILWLTTENGLNSFDRKRNEFKRYLHDPKNVASTSSDDLTGFIWRTVIAEDKGGNLWFATYKGLRVLNRERTVFRSFNYDISNLSGVSSDKITFVHVDRSDVLWVATLDGYLNKAILNQKPFETKRHDASQQHSLSDDKVTAIAEDKDGTLWIGTDGGGLNHWDKKNDTFTRYRHDANDPTTLRYDNVYGILLDREGDLWVCNGDMLSALDRQTRRFTHYNSNALNFRRFDHMVIYSITEDAEGLIWIGTGNGIKSFDKKSRTFKHYYHDPADETGISDYTAQAIFADSKNNIWIGYGSIATDRLNKKTGHIVHYKHDPRNPSSISSNIVKSFYEDSRGNLWLGTYSGGLCRFDYPSEKFTTYTDKHGLPDNTVFSILEDNEKNLWVSTGNGIARFDPAEMVFMNYYYKDGLQGNFFAAGHRNRPARARGNDGTLYFGGENGFNFFDPAQIKASSHLAPVVITNFSVFNNRVKGANGEKEIKLRHDENYFSFEFASLSFHNAEKNQYAYQLEGVDKDWVYSGSRRYVGYTGIEPGNYTFKVKATNNDGVWNEEGVSVSVIITPPWWRTWWAYFLYGIIAIVAIWRIHLYQKQKVVNAEREKARKRELDQAKEIEKAYHELKTTQAQLIQSEKMASLGEMTAGIAHEIQNPLNFVNNFSDVNKELIDELKSELATGNIQSANEIAETIKENEDKINHHGRRADGIVKGMLQHSRASSGQKELTDINALADEYLRLAYHGLRAKEKSFNSNPINIGIETDFDSSLPSLNVVRQDMGRVILNLINNAFYVVSERKKHEQDGYEPMVVVSTKKSQDKIEIKVIDNGNGIPQKIMDKIFQPFFTTKPTGQGTGLGLSLSYDIVKAHGGEIRVETTERQGSEFIVQLPV